MIVRINQLDLAAAAQEAGWAADGLLGPLKYPWPPEVMVYELLVLDRDEHKQPLDAAYRKRQLRQLIAQVAQALMESGDELVVRLDGPPVRGQLLAGVRRLIEEGARFAMSQIRKFDPDQPQEMTSLRAHVSTMVLAALCNDPKLGLDASVRLRLFAAPEAMVNPILDVDATDDERWDEILAACGFMFATTRQLRSLHVYTRRFKPDEIKARLAQRLLGKD